MLNMVRVVLRQRVQLSAAADAARQRRSKSAGVLQCVTPPTVENNAEETDLLIRFIDPWPNSHCSVKVSSIEHEHSSVWLIMS